MSGWRALSSVSLCKNLIECWALLRGLSCPSAEVAEVIHGCLFASRLSCLVWVCLVPVSCERVMCGLRLFVFGLCSLPFGAHAVRRAPRPSL
jgi:hypothetical protein